MAKYQVETPNGTYEIESPKDLSQEEQVALASHAASGKPASEYTPPLTPEMQEGNVKEAQREAFRGQPKLDQLLAGAGSWAYRLPGMGKLSELAGYGKAADKKDELQAYEDASKGLGPEDIGELAPDIAATLAGGGLATKGLQLGRLGMTGATKAAAYGAAQGLGSAAIHQLQNVGSGEGLKPGQAATEVLSSALLAGGGAKLAEKLKKVAPQVLRSATKPVLNQMDVPNPPDFEKALEKNLVPYFGGLEGTEKRAAKEVGRLGELRDLAAREASEGQNVVMKDRFGKGLHAFWSSDDGFLTKGNAETYSKKGAEEVAQGITDRMKNAAKELGWDETGDAVETLASEQPFRGVNALAKRGAVTDVLGELRDELADPKSRMTADMGKDAKAAVRYWAGQMKSRPTMKDGQMTVEDALHFRQAIDREVKFRETNSTITDGFNKASKMLRSKLNDHITKASPETGRLTKEMADVVPLKEALGRRNLQAGNNYKVGLMDLGSLATGGTLGMAAHNPSVAVPAMALAALAGRKLTSTPGGAAMMYDAGRSLADASATRNTLAQLARSTYAKGKR